MASQPRVNGPAVNVLTLSPGADAGRGCDGGTARPWWGLGPCRLDPFGACREVRLAAPARDVATSVCGRSSRIRSRRAAIPSETSSSSSSSLSSSSSRESSSDSPHASTWLDVPRALAARGSSSLSSSSPCPLWTFAS